MKRLVIAIDCDDVLVGTTPFFVDAYNVQYGTAVQLHDANAESTDVWKADRPLLEERLALLMETEGYRLLAPTPEAIEVLTKLAEHHELHVVTARRDHERELTQRMLDDMLPGVFHSLELVGWHGSKGEVCKRLGADVLIDDNVRHLKDAIAQGLPEKGALLFGDYAWNKHGRDDDGVVHCIDWYDVRAHIQALSER